MNVSNFPRLLLPLFVRREFSQLLGSSLNIEDTWVTLIFACILLLQDRTSSLAAIMLTFLSLSDLNSCSSQYTRSFLARRPTFQFASSSPCL